MQEQHSGWLFQKKRELQKRETGVLNIPARKQSGSPIIGTHDSRRDHIPYFL